MRITCPNCNAQYEVGDDMIPSEGRDVQCSNCGTTWFQEGRVRAASAVEERAIRRPGRRVADAVDPDDADDDAPMAPPAGRAPRRPDPDQETLDILREERAYDEKLRDDAPDGDMPEDDPAEVDTPEVNAPEVGDAEGDAAAEDTPEKPLADTPAVTLDPREQAAAERARMAAAATLARARGTGRRERGSRTPTTTVDPEVEIDLSDVIAETMRDASAPATEDARDVDPFDGTDPGGATPVSARTARRELLPDIEEINSSLRPDERAAEAEAAAEAQTEAPRVAKRMSGFRIGFLVACALILMMIGLYVFADRIAEAVPQIATLLAKYVAWVDLQRVAIAAAAESLTESIAPDR